MGAHGHVMEGLRLAWMHQRPASCPWDERQPPQGARTMQSRFQGETSLLSLTMAWALNLPLSTLWSASCQSDF